MMTNIENTLKIIRGQVMDYLIEMWPELAEYIKFAHDDNFQEWFGMLWKLEEWKASPYIVHFSHLKMAESRTGVAKKELSKYEDLQDYGCLSVVLIENDIHLIDGYHRVLLARKRGLESLPAVLWVKKENNHENCSKIRQLIIGNL